MEGRWPSLPSLGGMRTISGVTQTSSCFMPKSSEGRRKGCAPARNAQESSFCLVRLAAATQISQRHRRRRCMVCFPHLRLEVCSLVMISGSWGISAGYSGDHRHWNTLQASCLVCMNRICTLRPSWAWSVNSRLAALPMKAVQWQTCSSSTVRAGPWKQQGIPSHTISILIHLVFFLNPICQMPTCTQWYLQSTCTLSPVQVLR